MEGFGEHKEKAYWKLSRLPYFSPSCTNSCVHEWKSFFHFPFVIYSWTKHAIKGKSSSDVDIALSLLRFSQVNPVWSLSPCERGEMCKEHWHTYTNVCMKYVQTKKLISSFGTSSSAMCDLPVLPQLVLSTSLSLWKREKEQMGKMDWLNTQKDIYQIIRSLATSESYISKTRKRNTGLGKEKKYAIHVCICVRIDFIYVDID